MWHFHFLSLSHLNYSIFINPMRSYPESCFVTSHKLIVGVIWRFLCKVIMLFVIWRVPKWQQKWSHLVTCDKGILGHNNFPVVSKCQSLKNRHVTSLLLYLLIYQNTMLMLISQLILQMKVTWKYQNHFNVTPAGDFPKIKTHCGFSIDSSNDCYLRVIMRRVKDMIFYFSKATLTFVTICDVKIMIPRIAVMLVLSLFATTDFYISINVLTFKCTINFMKQKNSNF